ncbi:unnamed protein product [Cochlearia groenlandica]
MFKMMLMRIMMIFSIRDSTIVTTRMGQIPMMKILLNTMLFKRKKTLKKKMKKKKAEEKLPDPMGSSVYLSDTNVDFDMFDMSSMDLKEGESFLTKEHLETRLKLT